MNNLRFVLSENLKNAKNSSANLKENLQKLIYDRFRHLNKLYTGALGLDKVQAYQERVADLQNKLSDAQSERREIGLQLNVVRKNSNDLQEQLRKINRQEEPQKYLDLVKSETIVWGQETELSKRFAALDREERDTFTAYTNAVRDSHEIQRWQLEYTKYIGVILSLAGSLLAFLYATFYKEDIKKCIQTNVSKVEDDTEAIIESLNKIERKLKIAVSLRAKQEGELIRKLTPEEEEELLAKLLRMQVVRKLDDEIVTPQTAGILNTTTFKYVMWATAGYLCLRMLF